MRGRFSATAAVVQVILRAIAGGCSILTVGILIYCTTSFGQSLSLGYASSCWTLVFDTVNIILLLDQMRRGRKLGSAWLALAELLTVSLCVVAVITMLLVDMGNAFSQGTSYKGYVADPWRMIAAGLQGAVGVLHFWFLIYAAVEGCHTR